jgi:hypothetical protein
MTLRYAHLSPRYLADEVKTLDRFQQNGMPQTKSGAERPAPPEQEEPQPETDTPDGRRGLDRGTGDPIRARRSRRR